MAEPRISGAVLLNNFRAFQEEVGPTAFAAAIGRLAPEDAQEFHSLVPVAWMPSSVADRIFAAIAEAAGEDLEEIFPRVIERGVEKTVKSLWRPLMRLFSDRAILNRTPKIFAKTYTKGQLTAEFPESSDPHVKLAVFTLSDWPDTPRYRLLAIAAGLKAVLRVSGRKPLGVDFERTPDGARFDARWRR